MPSRTGAKESAVAVSGNQASPYAFTVGGQVFFDPHPGKQLEVCQRITNRVRKGEGARNWFLRGNRGGGKSVAMRKGVLHGLAMAIPGLRYVVVRRNMPDLRLNHLQFLDDEMKALGGSYHETHGICSYPNGSKGFYRQCEDARDVEKVVGAEAAILFVDEAPQIEWDHLTTMAPSVRVALVHGKQPYYGVVVYGGNPVGASIEELDQHFMDRDVDLEQEPTYDPMDWELIEIGLDDNPALDPEEYRKSLGAVPAQFRSAWLDGVRMDARTLFQVHKVIDLTVRTKHQGKKRDTPLPESYEDRPYHYISELPTLNGVPLLRVPWIHVYRGYDHGFFPDPAVCVWVAILGRRIYAVSEDTWFSTTAKEIAGSMIQSTKELVGETPVGMTCVDPDIAVKTGVVTVMDELEMHGVPCEPSINDRTLYADMIHSLLGEEIEPGVPRFQIYEPGCPLLAKYLPKMRWDEKNPRKMADHKFDHWVVALAYFAISSGVLSVTAKSDEAEEPWWMKELRESQGRKRGSRR